MAPTNPSPYRFFGGQRKPQSNHEDANVASTGGNVVVRHEQTNNPATPTQFAPTPRFSSFKSTQARPEIYQPGSNHKSSFAQALQRPRQHHEDVEETLHSRDGDEEMLDNDETVSFASDVQLNSGVPSYAPIGDLPYSPKRRRLDDILMTEPGRPHSSSRAPQFVQTQVTAVTSVDDLSGSRRPNFIRPSETQLETPQQPLPEVFSPHRRGSRFVHGGMAATVQQWVIETGQATVQRRLKDGLSGAEGYAMQFRVCAFSGSGPFVVEGQRPDGSEVHVVLTRNADSKAAQVKEKLEVGSTVGIRPPIVEVDLAEGKRVVAVDWRVLPS